MNVNLGEIKQTLLNTFKNAKIELVDETGDGKHLFLHIIAENFKDLTILERHKLVYTTLKEYMPSIHALSIKAEFNKGE